MAKLSTDKLNQIMQKVQRRNTGSVFTNRKTKAAFQQSIQKNRAESKDGAYAGSNKPSVRPSDQPRYGPNGSVYHPKPGESEVDFFKRTDQMINQDFPGKQKGQPGAAQGASGKNGGNPCHDSEGKFC